MGTKQSGAISEELLRGAEKKFQNSQLPIVADSIFKNGIADAAYSHEAVSALTQVFSDEIPSMEITNQKKSGRCWIFAGANVLRYYLDSKLHFKDRGFELSQSYLMFWDKFEKSNYFLESVIETAKEDKASRIVMWLFETLLADGGQWDMLVALIQKYGIVPKYAMPESFQSSNSAKMNAVLCKKLRRDGVILRNMAASGAGLETLRAKKEEMVAEVYGMLCCFLGEPPRSFDFAYRDRENVFHREAGMTPLHFYREYFADFLDETVSIVNAPTSDKPFGRTYTVDYLGNVVGGRPVRYLNLETSELERMAAAQIRDGSPVWFGSDVGKMSDRDVGVLDTDLYRYERILQTELEMSKADMLDYGQTCLTHAMMLLAADITENGVSKWKVENSWGADVGAKGFFVMSRSWFRTYVCQVVVSKKYLSAEQKAALETEPIHLEPWDPIGSLALTD